MKNACLFLCLAISFLSCVKPETPKVFVPSIYNWSGTDPMSAEINGTPWLASTATYSEFNGWKGVAGFDGSLKGISIALKDISAGTEYTLKDSFTNNTAFYIPAPGSDQMCSNTTDNRVKILENDATHIKGYFFFSTFNSITGTTNKVTKGYFNITK